VGEWEGGRVGEWESGRVGEWESGRVGECQWPGALGESSCGGVDSDSLDSSAPELKFATRGSKVRRVQVNDGPGAPAVETIIMTMLRLPLRLAAPRHQRPGLGGSRIASVQIETSAGESRRALLVQTVRHALSVVPRTGTLHRAVRASASVPCCIAAPV
jgi:hypothetical protein